MEQNKTGYWICVTSPKNFNIDALRGFNVIGFKDKNKASVKKFNKGDKIIYYINEISKFGAIAEVISGYYYSNEKIWVDEDEMWPSRAKIRPLFLLEREQFLDVRKLIPSLSFVPKSRYWGMAFRGSIKSIPEEDYRLIESEMRKAIVGKEKITIKAVKLSEKEAKDKIMKLELENKTLHDRIGKMLETIGTRVGFNAQTKFRITPEHHYELDVAWFRGKNPEIAIEIQIGGNITEAKDHLTEARKFNYRKVILVIEESQLRRLNDLIRYDELKNWLEAWTIQSVYKMYIASEQFFSYYEKLQESRYRDKKELELV